MLDAILAPHAIGAPRISAVLTALLLHVVLIIAAVGNTASPRAATRPIARDTIQLQMTELVELSRPEPAKSPRSGSDAILPQRPQLPAIPINALEFQPPRLSFTAGRPETTLTALHQRFPNSRVSPDAWPFVFSASDVHEPPVLLQELHPRYPEALQRTGVSGLVQVQYVVGRNGRIDERSVRVLGSSHPAFLLSALEALRNARFKPARRSGRPEAVLVQQTIRFRHR